MTSDVNAARAAHVRQACAGHFCLYFNSYHPICDYDVTWMLMQFSSFDIMMVNYLI